MHLKKLILEQFRNYQKLELDFNGDEHITSIIGENAQGKTNILEAIYLLALTKSFRTSKHQDLIGWNQEYARVKGFFDLSGNSTPALSTSRKTIELEVFLGNPPHSLKALKKNGVKTSTAEFIGTCQIVFFHPEDLNMLYLGPDLRRRYLDILNLQVNKAYFKALRTYHRVMDHRNALLHAIHEGRAAKSDLEIWNDQLVEHGSFIMLERAKTIAFFQENLQDYYQKISQAQEQVSVIYKHTLPPFNSADLPEIYKKTLLSLQAKDLQTRFTSIGPHRDDLEFFLNNFKLSCHASRGEYRSLLLALKLLELKFFEERTGQKPLLLLDDVFSELDFRRQHMLLEAIEGHQTIITTTQSDKEESLPIYERHQVDLKTSSLKKRQLFNISKGKLLKSP